MDPVHAAATDRDGEAVMQVPRYASGGENFYEARVVSSPDDAGLRTVAVPARTLDGLFGRLRDIDFVKCDVEGHELACLRGAADILRKTKPAWLIEVSGDPDAPDTSAAGVFALLADAGYEPFVADGGGLRPRRAGERRVNTFFLTRRHAKRIA